MLRFQKILFPVDFSDRCIHTTPYVAGIARKFNSRIVLLHVFNAYDPFTYGAARSTMLREAPIPALRDQPETAMASFGKAALDGLRVERVIEDGEPGETITRYARDHAVDLIVMPTHGYGGFRRLLLGSVIMQVFHEAACAVWTTAHCGQLDERCGRCISRMVCGVDLEGDSVRVIRCASELAQQYCAELRLVHAVSAHMPHADAPFQKFLIDTAVERLAAAQREAHTHLPSCVNRGHVADVIQDLAADVDAGLCIIGRGHANRLLGTLRTHVNAIVRESPCPVLSL